VKARRAVGLPLASLVLLACGTTCLGSVATTSAAALASATACQAKDLAVHGGRQGSPFQSVEGTVAVVNVSTFRCVAHVGTPFSLIQNDGVRLELHELTPMKAIPSIVLRAKRSTVLILSWNNWCRAHPGPLAISITLAGGAGVVSGPFHGPPNYNAVPGCINHADPSSLKLVSP
jgi:hypothetical protein